jgi:hypothetical protein
VCYGSLVDLAGCCDYFVDFYRVLQQFRGFQPGVNTVWLILKGYNDSFGVFLPCLIAFGGFQPGNMAVGGFRPSVMAGWWISSGCYSILADFNRVL